MTWRRLILLSTAFAMAGCGRVAELRPPPGKPLPVKPLMARTTPTVADLLALPSYAKPDRIDELVKRSQPRQPDPFDLPPPTGGAVPTIPGGSQPQPASDQTGPVKPQ